MAVDKTLEMKSMDRRSGYVGPLVLISIGFILLFNKLGLIHWVAWDSLLHYWPVLLILWGIEILAMHAKSRAVYFMSVILCIVIIIGSILLASNGYPPPDNNRDKLLGIIFTNNYIENNDFDFFTQDQQDLQHLLHKSYHVDPVNPV